MNKYQKILKLASAYFKAANLKENMALRIFHALIPTLVQDIHSQQEIEDIQKFMAFDLIPGAKEILELGAKAVAYEFDISTNEQMKHEIQRAVEDGNYIHALRLAEDGFLSDFRSSTGGKAWSNVSKHLLHLASLIKQVEASGSPSDAQKLSTYLDTIDQLAHNTGTLMEKLVQREMGTVTPEAQKRYEELLRLRDISKIEGSHPTALLMQQYLAGQPKEYQEWYRRYLAMHQARPGTPTSEEAGQPVDEQWQYDKYLPDQNGDEYNSALKLLEQTKRQRELENYLKVQDESGTVPIVSKKAPPAPPPRKKAAHDLRNPQL
jgi:hypothetical protein